MDIKEKIYTVLQEAYPALQALQDDYYIIGSAALVLSGIKIANISDIDILLTVRDAHHLQTEWKERLIKNHVTEHDDLFRSLFSRYRFDGLDIEAMGNLEVNKNGVWTPLKIENYTTVLLNDIPVKIPTREEQIRIFRFFGREKDIEKIKLLR